MKENINSISYEMYEELKETIIKTIKNEISATGKPSDNRELLHKIDKTVAAADRTADQVATLTNRFGQLNFRPVIQTPPPDLSKLKPLFEHICSQQTQLQEKQQQTSSELSGLKEYVMKLKTEVDTSEFEKLSRRTICEMQNQIYYLKQPPIVLKVITGLTIITLATTLYAGYLFRDRKEWREEATFWYRQSDQYKARQAVMKPPKKQ
ncbi:hypothetical protein [uncultured Alistipes sp.]|jgi:hypothetical protein|uniref:hypothetical protein n=1 Tax=uncultured Alistipes sp. TaxID=538949 RepID=UPI0025D845F0|nr:hypothetical protein [uncultured Alistipes sp.]